jgi:hypothetical protein
MPRTSPKHLPAQVFLAPPSKHISPSFPTSPSSKPDLLTRALRTTGACFINMPPSSSLLELINSYLETRPSAVPFLKDTTELPQLKDLTVNDTPAPTKTSPHLGGPRILDKKANKQ